MSPQRTFSALPESIVQIRCTLPVNQLTQRVARTELTVYRNVHTAQRRMLLHGAAHNIMRQLLIVPAGLRRQQAQTGKIAAASA